MEAVSEHHLFSHVLLSVCHPLLARFLHILYVVSSFPRDHHILCPIVPYPILRLAIIGDRNLRLTEIAAVALLC